MELCPPSGIINIYTSLLLTGCVVACDVPINATPRALSCELNASTIDNCWFTTVKNLVFQDSNPFTTFCSSSSRGSYFMLLHRNSFGETTLMEIGVLIKL